MNIKQFTCIVCLALLILLVGITGCEYDGPVAVWDADADVGGQPVITAVDPSESAGGASLIHILGEGFVADSTEVYFNDVRGEIRSITSTEIAVYRPNISGDSIAILVKVSGAVSLASLSGYEIPAVVSNYGKFVDPGGVYLMDFDADGNLWIMIRKRIYKILPSQDIIEVGQQDFRGSTSDIKIGPDGNLLMKKNNDELLYMIDSAQNDTIVEYAEFPENTSYFDFDPYGNIFSAGDGSGLNVLVGDTSYVVGNCEDLSVICLRVFDNAVYVLDEEFKIWRSQILDEAGHVADKERYIDLSSAGYPETEAFCFTFDADGICYVGTDHSDTVLMFEPNGDLIGPLFKGILFPTSVWMTWDNGDNLYVAREDSPGDLVDDLFQVRVDKAGAPYYGRGL